MPEKSDDAAIRISRAVLLAYGLPGLPLAALMLPLFVYLPTYYAEQLGLGFATVGAVLLVARLWDGVTDPLIGWLSDRVRLAGGRRKPWTLLGLPLAVVSIWCLFRPPVDVSWTYLLLWSALAYLGQTIIMLPYQAWGAELSDRYHERSRIAAAREVFVVAGTVAAAALPQVLGGDAARALHFLAPVLAVGLPLAVLICAVAVPDARPVSRKPVPVREGLRLLRRNDAFLRLIGAYFLNGVATGLPATLFLLFVGHVLKTPEWQGALLLTYFICGIAAVPGWLALSKRFGKHRIWIVSMIWASAIFVWVPFIGPGDVVWFAVICVLTGVSLGADLVLPASMQADVIDVDAAESGERRAGIYFALWGLATKISLALAVGIAFPVLEAVGFQRDAAANDATSLFVLAALYSLLPVVFKVASCALIARFPVDAAEQERLRQVIAGRQEEPA